MNKTRLTALGIIGAATLLGGVLTAIPAMAASDYYVSTSGSDSNSGTSSGAAFATLQQALNTAPSGSTIHLAAGTYLQDAVTVRAGVTVTGPSSAVVKGAGNARVLQVHHDDVTLSGFTIDGLVGSGAAHDDYRDKLIYVISTVAGEGVDRLRITGMNIRNGGGECVRMRYLVTQAEVDNNVIGPCGVHDFVFLDGGKNGEAIYIGTAPEQQGLNGAPDGRADVSRDNWVHHNTIDSQGNECVDIKENSTANLVEHNDCTGQKDPESAGFDARGSGNTFRYNASYGNVGAGIRFGGDTAADGVDNDAYGNTITGNAKGGIKFQATPQGQVCGNTMSGNTGGNSVGTYAGQFNPTAPCSGASPSPTPTASPSPTAPAGGIHPVCAVSASGDDGNVPANTLDNSLSTRWSDEGDGVFIQYDLCASVSIDHVAIAWHKGNQRTSEFEVWTSADGSSWTKQFDGFSSGSTTAQEVVDLADHGARYLKIIGFGNEDNEWTSITEVDVYQP